MGFGEIAKLPFCGFLENIVKAAIPILPTSHECEPRWIPFGNPEKDPAAPESQSCVLILRATCKDLTVRTCELRGKSEIGERAGGGGGS